MEKFGEKLRKHRRKSRNPEKPTRPISQVVLGELIDKKIGIHYTGQAIALWENGSSQIKHTDRLLLKTLIEIFFENGGIELLEEANEFLLAGGYAPLTDQDAVAIFGHIDIPESDEGEQNNRPKFELTMGGFLRLIIEPDFLTFPNEPGEPPRGLIFRVLDNFGKGWTSGDIAQLLFWIVLWLSVVTTMFPFFEWRHPANTTLQRYLFFLAAVLITPLFAGLLTYRPKDEEWHGRDNPSARRLFNITGAYIGFQLGMVAVSLLYLFIYYVFKQTPPLWVNLLVALFPLRFAYQAGLRAPWIVWKAYDKKLIFKENDWVLIIGMLFLGGGWATFAYFTYPYYLDPFIGITFLLTVGILSVGLHQFYGGDNGGIIPAHFWVLTLGVPFAGLMATEGFPLLFTIPYLLLILTSAYLLKKERFSGTVRGVFAACVGLLVLWGASTIDRWLMLGLFVVMIGLWMWKGRPYLNAPLVLGGVIALIVATIYLVGNGFVTTIAGLSALCLISAVLLVWDWFLLRRKGV